MDTIWFWFARHIADALWAAAVMGGLLAACVAVVLIVAVVSWLGDIGGGKK
jgi:Flp pilus assembly pilin Flp